MQGRSQHAECRTGHRSCFGDALIADHVVLDSEEW